MQKDDWILIGLGLFVISIFIIMTVFISFPDYKKYHISRSGHNVSLEESYNYFDESFEDYEYSDDNKSDVDNDNNFSKKESSFTDIDLKKEDSCRKIELSNGKSICSNNRLVGLETDGTREDRKRMISEIAIDMRDSMFNNEQLENIFGDISLGSRVCKIFLFESLGNSKDLYNIYFCDEEGIMIGRMRVDVYGVGIEDNIEYVHAVDYESFLVSDFEIETGFRINGEFNEEEEFPISTEEIITYFKSELGNELEITSIRLVSEFNSFVRISNSNIMYEITVDVDGITKKYYTNAYTNSTILSDEDMNNILQRNKEASRMPD